MRCMYISFADLSDRHRCISDKIWYNQLRQSICLLTACSSSRVSQLVCWQEMRFEEGEEKTSSDIDSQTLDFC